MSNIQPADFESLKEFLCQENLIGRGDWSITSLEEQVLVVRDCDRIQGVARTYRNWLHPERRRLAVYVTPDARRTRIGTNLMADSVKRMPPSVVLQIATSASNQNGLRFLDHCGFQLLMTTRLGRLDTVKVSARWRENCGHVRKSLESGGFQFQTLQSRLERFDDVVRLHEQIYREQHAWDPPVALTHEQCIDLFMDGDELDPEMQYLAFQYGKLCAIASLRSTAHPDEYDLGWIGSIGASPQYSRSLRQALLGMCVDDAILRNTSISLEIDRVDPHTNAIADELPIEWGEEWLTFCNETTSNVDRT